ncbi:hypothetical protein Acr_08g0007860 [Actinidia rufa]|uniref:Uncharacterized protein n=1 Tax=Actinidia rufa TaxID=165716 RepID=A0A7J0F156_9ERIC|nr:hypothetical protein Acr_08g0007860 [Actinidia rufa]
MIKPQSKTLPDEEGTKVGEEGYWPKRDNILNRSTSDPGPPSTHKDKRAPKSFHGYFLQEDVEGRVLMQQKVKPSSVLIPIDWAVKFDENRPKVLTPQVSNNFDHIKSLDDGVVRLTLISKRPDEDQGRMVYPLHSSLSL